jgi:chromosome segregation ATPase
MEESHKWRLRDSSKSVNSYYQNNTMSLTIETELKDIFTKIDQRLERMEQGQNELKLSVSDLKGEVKNLSTELKGEIKNLNTEVKNLSTNVDGLQKIANKLDEEISGSKQDISDLKGFKSLVVPGFVAILASLLTFVFKGINFP